MMAAHGAMCVGMVLMSLILLGRSDAELRSVTQDNCFGEKFEASCDEGEVIVMQNATYGRMALGRCVKEDFKLGCSTDVLTTMQNLCSGRTECFQPSVGGIFMLIQPCGEMLGYLEATFNCEKVVWAHASSCPPGDVSFVGGPSGTLSNDITGNTGCGNSDHPWVIRAGTYQRVRVAMRELTPAASPLPASCELYATITSAGANPRKHRICRGQTDDVIFTGSSLTVVLQSPALIEDKYFLLHYQVSGCPEPMLPADMWVRRGEDHLTTGCYSSRLAWRLDCVNGSWEGVTGNCTAPLAGLLGDQGEVMADEGARLPPRQPDARPATSTRVYNVTSEVGLVLAVAGGVLLSVMLLAVGLLFDKSQETTDTPTSSSKTSSIPVYGTNTAPRNLSQGTNRRQKRPNTTNHGVSTMKGRATDYAQESHPRAPGSQLRPPGNQPRARDSMAESMTSGYYDVPHYYELDPDYEESNPFVANGETNVLIDL